jgi:acyl-CoA dehydrogenase
MDFVMTKEQEMIAGSAREISRKFGPEYWYEKEENQSFPSDFLEVLGETGILGLGIPEEYGGSGMGLTEAVIAIEELGAGGGGLAPAICFVFFVVFGGMSILHHGTEEQKKKYLPKIAKGELVTALGLTEPDAGTDTLSISTFAEEDGNEFRINGNKVFITGFEDAGVFVLVARTIKKEDAPKKSQGISLFLVDLPNDSIKCNSIPKHGINYVKSYELGIHDLRVPREAILGKKDSGWYHILATLNPERIMSGIGAIGCAKAAIKAAAKYACERVVFDKPIGANQGIQLPLAAAYAKVECARLAVLKAAALYDRQASPKLIGDISNLAKYAAVEAAMEATYSAMQTYGGYGYAKEYHVERWWREIQLLRLAPISHQMTLNYIGEHILGMPRSY